MYAHLKTAEDTGNGTYQGMQARYINVASKAAQAASYIRPEIMAIDDARMKALLADEELTLYRHNRKKSLDACGRLQTKNTATAKADSQAEDFSRRLIREHRDVP